MWEAFASTVEDERTRLLSSWLDSVAGMSGVVCRRDVTAALGAGRRRVARKDDVMFLPSSTGAGAGAGEAQEREIRGWGGENGERGRVDVASPKHMMQSSW